MVNTEPHCILRFEIATLMLNIFREILTSTFGLRNYELIAFHPKGPNCYAGSQIIPAGERVDMDDRTVCYCTYREGSWHIHPQATCEQQPQDSPPPATEPEIPRSNDEGYRGRGFNPKWDAIP